MLPTNSDYAMRFLPRTGAWRDQRNITWINPDPCGRTLRGRNSDALGGSRRWERRAASGDLLQVCADRKFLSFMWNYPNYIPLGSKAVQAVATRVDSWPYKVIYGAFFDHVIPADAKRITEASVARPYRDPGTPGGLIRKAARDTVFKTAVSGSSCRCSGTAREEARSGH
jgi:hypothetical protein